MSTLSPIDGGVMAAVLTPLNDDLSPNHAVWLDHSRDNDRRQAGAAGSGRSRDNQ